MNNKEVIAICGAGTMGRGIALACIQSGYPTFLYDINTDLLEKNKSFILNQIDKLVEKGKLGKEDSTDVKNLLTTTTSIPDISQSDIIIEAIVENVDIKETLFKGLEDSGVKDTTILASNTSSLSINVLSSKRQHPENFVGLHFFNPANLMKLVEIVTAKKSCAEAVERCVRFVRSLGKTAVIARDVPGFIVNRVARNYYNEAMRIVTEGNGSVEVIDSCMKNWGFKMGPFELMDLIGNDINLEVTKSVNAQYFNEPRFAPSTMQQEIVNAGTYGQKSGQGFYRYDRK